MRCSRPRLWLLDFPFWLRLQVLTVPSKTSFSLGRCVQARCDEVSDALVEQGLKATALHGGRSQSEREAALRDFRKGITNILVSTVVINNPGLF